METEGAVSSANILDGCLRMEAVGYLVTEGERLLYAKDRNSSIWKILDRDGCVDVGKVAAGEIYLAFQDMGAADILEDVLEEVRAFCLFGVSGVPGCAKPGGIRNTVRKDTLMPWGGGIWKNREEIP